jgi:3,4-dihydroxy 2-butanone 4-phosphate synthase/GTP cyclohydrolase II
MISTQKNQSKTFMFHPIKEAINVTFQNGKVVIIVDDKTERMKVIYRCCSNCDARNDKPMAAQGRGLISAPLTEDRCNELDLTHGTNNGFTSLHSLQFL